MLALPGFNHPSSTLKKVGETLQLVQLLLILNELSRYSISAQIWFFAGTRGQPSVTDR